MSKFNLRNTALAIAVASALAACGGHTASSMSGKIVDGYVSGATITLDVNDNRQIDVGIDPTTTADGQGNFTFTTSQNPTGLAHMIFASGGTDISTGLPFVGQLSAPPGSTQVTPLTSIVMAQILASGNLPAAGTPISTATATAAAATVATSLGLPASVPLLTTDPVAAATSTPALIQTTAAVQVLLQQVTSAVQSAAGGAVATQGNATSNAIYANAMQSIASKLTAATPIDLTSAASAGAVATLTSNVTSSTVTAAATNPVVLADATTANMANVSPASVASVASSAVATLVSTVAQAPAADLSNIAPTVAQLAANPATQAQNNVAIAQNVGAIATSLTTANATSAATLITNMATLNNANATLSVATTQAAQQAAATAVASAAATVQTAAASAGVPTVVISSPTVPPIATALTNVLLINSYKVNGVAVANGAVTVAGPVASATLNLSDVASTLPATVSLGFDLTEAATGRKLTVIVDKIALAAGPAAGQITATVGVGSMTTGYYKTQTNVTATSSLPTVANGLVITQQPAGSTDVALDIPVALAGHPTILAAATNLKGTFTATATVSGAVLAKTANALANTTAVTIPGVGGVTVSGYGTTAALTVQ